MTLHWGRQTWIKDLKLFARKKYRRPANNVTGKVKLNSHRAGKSRVLCSWWLLRWWAALIWRWFWHMDSLAVHAFFAFEYIVLHSPQRLSRCEYLNTFTPCFVSLYSFASVFFCENSFKSSIQACLPQCRVAINCKFFTMASIEGIYQLLIVSYVLASGRDLVTPSRGSSESTIHRWRVKAADPTLATGPHSLTRRLSWLMTSWEGQSNC